VVGVNCICYGLVVNGTCNQCYSMAHSQWVNGQCACVSGYYLLLGQCQPYSASAATNITNTSAITPSNSTGTTTKIISCQPGTILSKTICIPCSNGCLSCVSQTICTQCSPQFNYNWASYSCL
jgi:hypothetical protein